MLIIELNETSFLINGHSFKFPILIADLTKILGEARRSAKKYNIIYTFDEHGIMGFSKNDKDLTGLMASYIQGMLDTSPKKSFSGEIILVGHEARNLKKNHPKKLIKLFEEDDSGAVVSNNISAWYKMSDSDSKIVEGIEFGTYERADLISKNLIPLEKEYKYLETVWMNWIAAIEKKFPLPQKHFNLKSGIEASDIKKIENLNVLKIPIELIQFYQFRDVKYNPVSSLFQFTLKNSIYYLIAFDKIKKNWDDINDLQSDDESKSELELGSISKELRFDNYANPKWIPIAEDYNGNYLLYDCDPSEKGRVGQIIELQNESGERKVVAHSLKELIEAQIIFLQKS